MKLLIEKIDGTVYAYRETEKHHKAVQPKRGTPRLDPTLLSEDCDLSDYSDFHMVFDLKKKASNK